MTGLDKGPHPASAAAPRAAELKGGQVAGRLWQLDRGEALRLLGSVSMGRVVFTQKAMPAIRLVNHLPHANGQVIIRTHLGDRIR